MLYDSRGRRRKGGGEGEDKWIKTHRLRKPPTSGWSWVNQGSSTIETKADGSLLLTSPAEAAQGDNLRLRVRTAPTAPYSIAVQLRAGLYISGTAGDEPSAGIGWRDDSGGTSGYVEMAWFHWSQANNRLSIVWSRYTSPTVWSATPYSQTATALLQGPNLGLVLNDDGANLTLFYLPHGTDEQQQVLYTQARTTFLTPRQVVFGCNPYSTDAGATLRIYGWEEL